VEELRPAKKERRLVRMPLRQELPGALQELVRLERANVCRVRPAGRVPARAQRFAHGTCAVVLYKGHVPRIRPCVGLLYDTALAGSLDALTTPPYDIIDDADRDRYYAASPYNVVRLIRGRHLPGDDDITNRYERAARLLDEWR